MAAPEAAVAAPPAAGVPDEANIDEIPLDAVAAQVGLPATWDVLIVGDGAGCWWDGPCGWGCILVDRHQARRRAFYGGLSTGSITIAELLPTVHAMLWYDEFHGRARKAQLGRGLLEVHVLTDNETTVKHWALLATGGAAALKVRRKRPLWNVLLQLERVGYHFHFHWIPRQSVGLNKLADKVAGTARRAIPEVRTKSRDGADRSLDVAIYTINPSG